MARDNRKHSRYPFHASSITGIKRNGNFSLVSAVANNLSSSGLGIKFDKELLSDESPYLYRHFNEFVRLEIVNV
ncbi:hypothetical protein BMS3Bbin05_00029 [bacterium BMS3Bbin05]|nr:hypothetical protein BMS3Bbin05_00029 [bacterium BMS3Bbin05]HDO22605.1 hypothetical protein [Nitrospirota bacterium]HDZ88906.1 hypothetical protein [Nitrospirota bacterium]